MEGLVEIPDSDTLVVNTLVLRTNVAKLSLIVSVEKLL